MENSIVKCLIRHENMRNQSLHNYGVKRWWNDIDAISTQCIKCSTQIKTDMHLTLKFISCKVSESSIWTISILYMYTLSWIYLKLRNYAASLFFSKYVALKEKFLGVRWYTINLSKYYSIVIIGENVVVL